MKREIDPFAMIEFRRKLNKKKVFFAIVILLTIVGLCVYGGIQAINSKNEEERQKYQIEEVNVDQLDIYPKDNAYFKNTEINKNDEKLAKLVASADKILISTPFWDMSFPSLLKSFLEKISLFDVMFISDDKKCIGIAKCPFMYYVTTRGMDIHDGDELEQGTPYLKALCWLWGIKKYEVTSCSNFDYLPQEAIDKEIEKKIALGIKKLKELIK